MKLAAAVTSAVFLLSATCFAMPPSMPPLNDYAVWDATDVVVASEGAVIDGKVTVIKALKGDLQEGEVVEVRELARFAPRDTRVIAWGLGPGQDRRKAPCVSGQRMILFLSRSDDGSHKTPRNFAIIGGPNHPSVAWIEYGLAWAFNDHGGNEGVLEPARYDTEDKLARWVAEIVSQQDDLKAIAEVADPSERAVKAARFANSTVVPAVWKARQILEGSGEAAAPVLVKLLEGSGRGPVQAQYIRMLYRVGAAEEALAQAKGIISDDARIEDHATVIGALIDSGDPRLGPLMIHVVEEELEFWRVAAPKMTKDWSSNDQLSDKRKALLSWHYNRAVEALYALGRIAPPECREVVTLYRDLWKALAKNGLKQRFDAHQAAEDVLWVLDHGPQAGAVNQEDSD